MPKWERSFAAVARILRRDQVGAGEHGERAKRNVGEVADRRRHEIEAGGSGRSISLGERGFNALNRCALRLGRRGDDPARMRL